MFSPSHQTPDDTVIARIRAGDHGAFESLFRQYFHSLANYANTIVQSHDAALDIVEDVFTALWQSHAVWNPSGGIRAYLLTAVRNRSLNALRDAGRRWHVFDEQHPDDMPGVSIPPLDVLEQLEHDEQMQAIRTVIAGMPPMRREVANLRWTERLEFREIAQLLGVSEKTVRHHASLALQGLKQYFAGR